MTHTINIAKFSDSIVIHFSTDEKRINAYTLASTLVSLADAAKAANSVLNAGYEIEIVVDAIGPGSFRAQIKALYKAANNLFSQHPIVSNLVLAVLCSYIYEHTLALDNKTSVEIKTEEVIITKGNDRVIIPRKTYEAAKQVEKNPQFVKSMSRTFEAISSDGKIESFGFVSDLQSPPPPILIHREAALILASRDVSMSETRTIKERAELQIVKAILKKSNRKWEFAWRGMTISAPVLADSFYVDFSAHRIAIAPGDTLDVTLHIKQVLDTETGIYTNAAYEVAEVHKHIPRIKQTVIGSLKTKGPG